MTEQLQQIIEQASQLSNAEKFQLVNLLLKQTEDKTSQTGVTTTGSAEDETQHLRELKRHQRIEWLKQNQAKYGGMYVALDGDKLLGVGKTYSEAAQAARTANIKRPYIDYVPVPDSIGFGGW